eukprot:jgi/Hompol1/1270/HPOL_000646-RA
MQAPLPSAFAGSVSTAGAGVLAPGAAGSAPGSTISALSFATPAGADLTRMKRELSFGATDMTSMISSSTTVHTPTPASASIQRRRAPSGQNARAPPQNKQRTHKRKSDAVSGSSGGATGGSTGLRSNTPEMDEQLYCFCQQVSYGEMIACDGEDCAHEWFHLECVGLSEPPTKGEWFCKDCSQLPKKTKKTRESRASSHPSRG